MKRDPYLAIMKAAANGKGLTLTYNEVFDLACDDAIQTRAQNALSNDQVNKAMHHVQKKREAGKDTDWLTEWEKIDTSAEQPAANAFIRSGE